MNTVAGKERRDPVLKGVGDQAESRLRPRVLLRNQPTKGGHCWKQCLFGLAPAVVREVIAGSSVSVVWLQPWLGGSLLEAVSLWFGSSRG